MSKFVPQISRAAEAIQPSGIRRFFDLPKDRADAISLGVGEPDFVTPWHVRDAGIYSLEKGFTKYTPNSGISVLRKEISAYMERRFSLSYSWDGEILVTVGGSEAIDLGVRAVINPGDEVLIPEPSFVCYGPIVSLAGGVPVRIATRAENRFRLTADEVRDAVTPRTRMLILPFPNNPTGAVMEREDLQAVADAIKDTQITVLSDEIYSELTYGFRHTSIAGLNGMRERTIVVGGLSKSHAMTGWRMGFCCADSIYMKQMIKIHQYAVMCAPTTSQYAAVEAVKNGDGDIERMREDYNNRRRLMAEGFRSIGMPLFEPQGAFYTFPSIESTGMTSENFCQELLSQEAVAVIPGGAFGESGEGFIRACYCASVKDITDALDRIGRFLDRNCG